MTDTEPEPRKLFTVAEVNAMLPLVRAIVTDLVELTREVVERRERLGHLLHDRDELDEESSPDDPYHAELVHVEKQLRLDAERLRELVDELRKLGAEPKDGMMGLVDFPTMKDDRVVCLCWKLDEPEVLFWHEWEAGFGGRQPLQQSATVPIASAVAPTGNPLGGN